MRYVKSSYWGSWSRVLCAVGSTMIEVNLTPIPNCYDSQWENYVAPIRVRKHHTARDARDTQTDTLPASVIVQMVKHLGEDLTNRLLTEDFLPQIDWSLYAKVCNGGANLADIKKGKLR